MTRQNTFTLGLNEGDTYNFEAYAVDSNGNSVGDPGAAASATVPFIAPAITGIALSGGGPYTPTAATVSWTTTSSLSESMQVLRSLDGGRMR
jgi:hypothetical protein